MLTFAKVKNNKGNVNMIKKLQDLLSLSQDKKDALLIMAIDRLATEYRVFGSRQHICDVTTSGNYMHQIAQLKCSIKSSHDLINDICQQADVDIDTISKDDDFHYVLNMFNETFPRKK